MTFTNEQSEILKVDERGRVWTPKERREGLLDEFERSGISGVQFAKTVGVRYPTFAAWVGQRKKARSQGGEGDQTKKAVAPSVHLFEALAEVAVSARAQSGVRVELPGGAYLHVDAFSQVPVVAELLRLLSQGAKAC